MTEPPSDDWRPWYDPYAVSGIPLQHLGAFKGFIGNPGAVVELWRAEWGNETRFLRVADLHPAMNVAGLWWREA